MAVGGSHLNSSPESAAWGLPIANPAIGSPGPLVTTDHDIQRDLIDRALSEINLNLIVCSVMANCNTSTQPSLPLETPSQPFTTPYGVLASQKPMWGGRHPRNS